MALEKYYFEIEQHPRTQHRNADGLSKRTNDYKHREALLGLQPAVVDKWKFLSPDQFDKIPVATWFDIKVKIISNHPQLPQYLTKLTDQPTNVTLRSANRTKRNQKAGRRERALRDPLPPLFEPIAERHIEYCPDHPEDWIDLTEECGLDYLLPIQQMYPREHPTLSLVKGYPHSRQHENT